MIFTADAYQRLLKRYINIVGLTGGYEIHEDMDRNGADYPITKEEIDELMRLRDEMIEESNTGEL